MVYPDLQKLREKLYFSVEDVSELLGIKIESARVLCSRYSRIGMLVRLKNNFYVLEEKWKNLSADELLKISNVLQVPSYVSFMTALSFYGLTTQVQRKFFESVSLKRTIRYEIRDSIFKYFKLKKDYYFDYVKRDNVFIATPEKAFVDSAYLLSLKKYSLDVASIDIGKLNKQVLRRIAESFPVKTRKILKNICRI